MGDDALDFADENYSIDEPKPKKKPTDSKMFFLYNSAKLDTKGELVYGEPSLRVAEVADQFENLVLGDDESVYIDLRSIPEEERGTLRDYRQTMGNSHVSLKEFVIKNMDVESVSVADRETIADISIDSMTMSGRIIDVSTWFFKQFGIWLYIV